MKKAVLSLLCAIFPLKTRRNKTQSVSAINKKKIFPFYTPVIDYGSNNSVVVYMPDGKKRLNPEFLDGISLTFIGSQNRLEIYEPCRFKNVCLIIGNASRVIFKQNTISSLETFIDNQSDLQIQEGTSINGAVIRMAEGHGNFLSIGKDCLLSDEILFRPSDGHVILDKTTGKLLNKPQGITIGDHVWIGQRAVFLKGASVADNSIVGASSVVTKRFDEKNIIIAGNPAKKIRENIEWKRDFQ